MYVSELSQVIYSGANWIDALVSGDGSRSDLNPLQVSRSTNTVYYSFTIGSDAGQERGIGSGSTSPFNAYQQSAARELMAHAAQVTGINFVETASADAEILFGYCDINGASTSGITSLADGWRYDGSGRITEYDASRMVFLDSEEWGSYNLNPTAGGQGYETLLHEIGHALGLEHPFEDPVRLPSAVDNTDYTVMSYTDGGGYKTGFQPYDLSALVFLYGLDGLGGGYGVDADALYYYGTAANEAFSAGAQSAAWYGGGGDDSLSLGGSFEDYAWRDVSGDLVAEAGAVRHVISSSIERIEFSGGADYSFGQLSGLVSGSGTSSGGGQVFQGQPGQDDVFSASAGDDTLIGSSGLDRIEFPASRGEFSLTALGDGLFSIQDRQSRYGTDRLDGIERIHFSDARLALDLQPGQAAAQALQFIGVLAPGLIAAPSVVGDILDFFDQGYSQKTLFQVALDIDLVASLAGGDTDTHIAYLAYVNLLKSEPDQASLSSLTGLVGVYGQAGFLAAVAELDQNNQQIGLTGLQATGVEYL
ncbi:hypothetical protein D5125_05525 [Magnetovirga frankeli]|uniref:hypothetical protein n=1 Tax=Magnetovirga frankeli TaxID=947516 RepID=UPI001292F4DE|nr:hypothetical protein D5125_05525 [gamma proteobacterium SS-5]